LQVEAVWYFDCHLRPKRRFAIRGRICVSFNWYISIAQGSPAFKITAQQTRAERRGVAKDMGGRLGDAASIIGVGGGERLPLFLTFPYTQIARQAGYRFQSLYHLGQKRIRSDLTFTLEPQGRYASMPARTRIRPPVS